MNLVLGRHGRYLQHLGRPGRQRLGEHGLRLQRRLHLAQGEAHLQVRRHVTRSTTTTGSAASAKPAAWVSATRKRAFRGGSNPNAGGNAFASFLLGYADSGQIDTVRFIGQQFYYFGRVFSGRLARHHQAGFEPGSSLRHQPAADRPRQPLERLRADHPESGRGRHSGRGAVRRQLHRLRRFAGRWPTCGPRASARTSVSLIRKTRRP